MSLNVRLIKLVKEQSLILCNSKFTACVILKKNIKYSPLFVLVAVPIIDIHGSLTVTLYLIKHRTLIGGGFIDKKSLHVMYYRLFHRSSGL